MDLLNFGINYCHLVKGNGVPGDELVRGLSSNGQGVCGRCVSFHYCQKGIVPNVREEEGRRFRLFCVP